MLQNKKHVHQCEIDRMKNLCAQAQRQFELYKEHGTPEERKEAHGEWQIYERMLNAICELS